MPHSVHCGDVLIVRVQLGMPYTARNCFIATHAYRSLLSLSPLFVFFPLFLDGRQGTPAPRAAKAGA